MPAAIPARTDWFKQDRKTKVGWWGTLLKTGGYTRDESILAVACLDNESAGTLALQMGFAPPGVLRAGCAPPVHLLISADPPAKQISRIKKSPLTAQWLALPGVSSATLRPPAGWKWQDYEPTLVRLFYAALQTRDSDHLCMYSVGPNQINLGSHLNNPPSAYVDLSSIDKLANWAYGAEMDVMYAVAPVLSYMRWVKGYKMGEPDETTQNRLKPQTGIAVIDGEPIYVTYWNKLLKPRISGLATQL
jgi:hypothetical protein